MNSTELITRIRAMASSLPFESPTRGAVIVRRLAYHMPPSESLSVLSESGIAVAVIERTIRHSHQAHAMLHQDGTGHVAIFSRHVIEGDRRWDFEVEVTIDRSERAMISDVQVVRPGDDEPDDLDDGPDRVAAAAARPTAGLTTAELLDR